METKNLKLIGKGMFSKVYQLNDKEVLIKSNDLAKECICYMVESDLVPDIEQIEDGIYKMEYFPKVKSLKDSLDMDQYKLYQELSKLNISIGMHTRKNDYYFLWREQFETISDEEVREDLLNVIDCMCNYGADVRFEISPRNVAVKNGKLVLLDCFFFASQLEDVRNSKKRYSYS